MHRPCNSSNTLPLAWPEARSATRSISRPCWRSSIENASGLPSSARRSPMTPFRAASTASRSGDGAVLVPRRSRKGSSRSRAACKLTSTRRVTPRIPWYTRPVSPRARPASEPPGRPMVPSTDWCTPSVMWVTPVVAWVAKRATPRRSAGRKCRNAAKAARAALSGAGLFVEAMDAPKIEGNGPKDG